MKYLIVLLSVALIFSFVGCNKSPSPDAGPIVVDERNANQKTADDKYLNKCWSDEQIPDSEKPENVNYIYYNDISFSNKPSQQIVDFYAIKKIDDNAMSLNVARRYMRCIISTDFLDIYIDISSDPTGSALSNTIRKKSVDFGEREWIKFLKTFYDNRNDFVSIYGNYLFGGHSDTKNTKLSIVFTDMPTKNMDGYYDSKSYSPYLTKYDEITVKTKNLLFLNRNMVLKKPNVERIENIFFYELQHLTSHVGARGGNNWVNSLLSESTYYLIRWNTAESKPGIFNNYRNDDNTSFLNWNYTNYSSFQTVNMFTYWLFLHFGGNSYDEKWHAERNVFSIIVDTIREGDSGMPEKFSLALERSHSGNIDSELGNIYVSWLKANAMNSKTGLYGYKGDNASKKLKVPSHDLSLFGGNYDAGFSTYEYLYIDKNDLLENGPYKEFPGLLKIKEVKYDNNGVLSMNNITNSYDEGKVYYLFVNTNRSSSTSSSSWIWNFYSSTVQSRVTISLSVPKQPTNISENNSVYSVGSDHRIGLYLNSDSKYADFELQSIFMPVN